MSIPHSADAFVSVEDMLAASTALAPAAAKRNKDLVDVDLADHDDGIEDSHPDGEYAMMQRLNSLEYANATLQSKIERMEAERNLQSQKSKISDEVSLHIPLHSNASRCLYACRCVDSCISCTCMLTVCVLYLWVGG